MHVFSRMLPSTVDRVPNHTSSEVNARLRRETHQRLQRLIDAGPEAIDERLRELDQEWDIERALEANAASLALGGIVLGAFASRKLLFFPALVTGFLLQHALQGWCPPVGLLRRRGFRTAQEIEEERYALKALRGDFDDLKPPDQDGQRRRLADVLHAVHG